MIMQLDEDLWIIDHDFSMLGIPIGTRTTLLRLGDGGLFMHSPGPLTPELVDEINALGPLRCIVAPNEFHHLYVSENAEAWPEARVFLAKELPRKRSDLDYEEELADRAPALWQADLEQVWIQGAPSVNEVVFFHRRSRSLIVTDLAFNFSGRGPLLLRLFLWINAASGQLAFGRLIKIMFRDLELARESIERIFSWDFERVILCHGEVVETGGREKLRPCFDWLLKR
jgi:hypothetical protein